MFLCKLHKNGKKIVPQGANDPTTELIKIEEQEPQPAIFPKVIAAKKEREIISPMVLMADGFSTQNLRSFGNKFWYINLSYPSIRTTFYLLYLVLEAIIHNFASMHLVHSSFPLITYNSNLNTLDLFLLDF